MPRALGPAPFRTTAHPLVVALATALLAAASGCVVQQAPPLAPAPAAPFAPGVGPGAAPSSAPPAPAAGPAPSAVSAPPLDYANPAWWVCRGDLPTDACRQDMAAIELRPDGSRVSVPFAPAVSPDVDCFYVYPTVDLRTVPGSHTDFRDTGAERSMTRAQAARFGEVCRVFAPLYRQATWGTLLSTDVAVRVPPLELAYADVRAAFDAYLRQWNGGRRVVLLGHSQGGGLLVRLLAERFENDAALRAKLVVAIPAGADFTVGELPNVPACTRDDQVGCVVTYKSFLAGSPARSWSPPTPGRVNLCVNPADVAGNARRPLAQALFPTREPYGGPSPGPLFLTAPFLLVDGAYSAQCEEGIDGFRYLGVQATGPTPLPLTNPAWRGPLGLHAMDLQLAQGDLIEMVRRMAARR